MPRKRSALTCTTLAGQYVIALGGWVRPDQQMRGLCDATILDVHADLAAAGESPGGCAQWAVLPHCPHPHVFAAAATDLDGVRAYVTGGSNQVGAHLDMFDAGSQQWLTTPPSLSSARWGPTMTFLADGRLMVVGGGCTARGGAYEVASKWAVHIFRLRVQDPGRDVPLPQL